MGCRWLTATDNLQACSILKTHFLATWGHAREIDTHSEGGALLWGSFSQSVQTFGTLNNSNLSNHRGGDAGFCRVGKLMSGASQAVLSCIALHDKLKRNPQKL